MNSVNVLKRVAGVLVAGLAWCAMADAPVISDVVVRQRWPWSRLVDIDYVLTGDPTDRMDVLVTAKDGSVDLVLPPGALSGNLFGVAPGPRRIIFDPTQTVYTNNQMLTQFSVTLTPTVPAVYMVVDLTKAAGQEGLVEYIYPGDGRLVTEGRYTNVWFDVTNDVYKTDKMVFRRIPAGTFIMGSPSDEVPRDPDPREKQHTVTLTKDYWMGVFEVTKSQRAKIIGGVADKTPYNTVYFTELRGHHTNEMGVSVYNWPTNGHAVAPDSFIGKLREQTGGVMFDLPTDAQWEHACRAGTTGKWNSGRSDLTTNDIAEISEFCWYRNTGGSSVKEVGRLVPNAWGLYDMHGNVWEWCLDWYDINYHNYSPEVDPLGPMSAVPASPNLRCKRGGAYSSTDGKWIRSAYRSNMPLNSTGADHGFRLCVPIE